MTHDRQADRQTIRPTNRQTDKQTKKQKSKEAINKNQSKKRLEKKDWDCMSNCAKQHSTSSFAINESVTASEQKQPEQLHVKRIDLITMIRLLRTAIAVNYSSASVSSWTFLAGLKFEAPKNRYLVGSQLPEDWRAPSLIWLSLILQEQGSDVETSSNSIFSDDENTFGTWMASLWVIWKRYWSPLMWAYLLGTDVFWTTLVKVGI